MRNLSILLLLFLIGCGQPEPVVVQSDPEMKDIVISAPASGATFRWTPSVGQIGEHDVTFKATDSKGTTTKQAVTITVLPGDCVVGLPEFAYQTGDIDQFRAFLRLWGYGWQEGK